jgi:hypothetical protein
MVRCTATEIQKATAGERGAMCGMVEKDSLGINKKSNTS